MVEIKKRKYHEPKAGVFSDLLHLVPGTSCPLVSTYQQFFERRSHCISDQLPSGLQKGTYLREKKIASRRFFSQGLMLASEKGIKTALIVLFLCGH